MPHRVAEVHQPPFRQQDHALAVREGDLVDLRLDVGPFQIAQVRDLDLVVEVADVADDGAVLHRAHVLDGDDVLVAGGSDKNVGAGGGIFHGRDFIAFHRRLQRADRIDFGYHDAAAGLAQRSRRALADVAKARHHRHLAGHHHIGTAADAVDQGFTAAIEIIELRLGDAVVDVDRREQKRTRLLHVVEPVHAGGGFFRDPPDVFGDLAEPALRLFLQHPRDQCEEDFFLLAVVLIEKNGVAALGAHALMHEHGGVAAVIEDHVGRAAAMPVEQLCGVVPVFLEALALHRKHGNAGRGDRGRGMVLRRIDVAGDPADVGAECCQRLDQHRGLDRHVQGAGDPRTLQRLLRAVFLARCHQARHLGLGKRDFLAAEFGEADVGDDVVGEGGLLGGGGGHDFSCT